MDTFSPSGIEAFTSSSTSYMASAISISLAPGSGHIEMKTAGCCEMRAVLRLSTAPSSTRAISRIRISAPSTSRITNSSNSSALRRFESTSRSTRRSRFSLEPIVAMILLRASARVTSCVPTLNAAMRSGSSQIRIAGSRPPSRRTSCTPGIAANWGLTRRTK